MDTKLYIYIDKMPEKILDYWHQDLSMENMEVNRMLHTPILQWLPEGEFSYLGCEKIKELKVGNTNKIVFKIDSNLYWEDGAKVISKDFYFWLLVKKSKFNIKGEKMPWLYSEIEIVTDDVFAITFDPLYPFGNINDTLIAAPSHLLIDEWKKVCNQETDAVEFFSNINPVSNGKYKLNHISEQTILLELNEANNKLYEKADYKKVEFRSICKEKIEYKNDMIVISNDYEMKKEMDNSLQLLSMLRDSNTWVHFEFNCFCNSIFSNKELRKIVCNLIDIEKIIYALNNEEIRRVDNFIYDKSKMYKCNPKRFNKKRALTNLKKLGYSVWDDGYLHSQNGIKLMIRLISLSGVRFIEETCEIIKKDFMSVGIDLIVEYASHEELFSEHYILNGENNSFDMILNFWKSNPVFEKGEMYVGRILEESNVPTLKNGYRGSNVSGYVNEEYDYMFRDFCLEVDLKERNKLLCKMARHFEKEMLAVSLFQKSEKIYFSKNLSSIKSDAFTQTITWNFSM